MVSELLNDLIHKDSQDPKVVESAIYLVLRYKKCIKGVFVSSGYKGTFFSPGHGSNHYDGYNIRGSLLIKAAEIIRHLPCSEPDNYHDFRNLRELIEYLKSTPQTKVDQILRVAGPFLRKMEDHDVLSLIKAIEEVLPRPDIDDILGKTLQVLGVKSRGYSIESQIKWFAKLNVLQRAELMSLAAPALEKWRKSLDGHGILDFLSEIEKTDTNDRKNVVNCFNSMITEEHGVDQTAADMIKFLRDTPEREELLLRTAICRQGDCLWRQRTFLEAAKNVPREERKVLFEQLDSIIKIARAANPKIRIDSDVIRFGIMIPVADRSDQVLLAILALFSTCWTRHKVENIIEETPPEERAKVVSFFAQAEVDHKINVEWLAERMLKIPAPGSRLQVAQQVLSYHTPGTETDFKKMFVFFHESQSRIAEVVEIADAYFKDARFMGIQNSWEFTDFCKYVLETPQEKRKSLINEVLEVAGAYFEGMTRIKPFGGFPSFEEIYKTVMAEPQAERKFLLEVFPLICKADELYYGFCTHFRSYFGTPSEMRKVILLTLSKLLPYSNIDEQPTMSIIRFVKLFPKERIQEILDILEPLFRRADESSHFEIFDHFAKFLERTPEDERVGHELILSILSKIFPYAGLGAYQVEQIIKLVSLFPPGNTNEALELLDPLFSKSTDRSHLYFDLLTQLLEKFPKDQRIVALKRLLPLLAPHSVSSDNDVVEFISMLLDPGAKQEPLEQLQALLDYLQPYTQETRFVSELYSINRLLENFPEDQIRTASDIVLMQIVPKLGSLRGPDILHVIADFLDKGRKADRMHNLNAVIPFATSYIATTYGSHEHDDREGVASVLNALWRLPVDDRADVLSRADNYAQNRPVKDNRVNVEAMYLKGRIDRVVLSIAAIPRRERDTVLALMGRYNDVILLKRDGTDYWWKLVKWIGYVPRDHRQEFIEKLIVYRKNCNFKSIVEVVALLPSPLWSVALKHIDGLPNEESTAPKLLTSIFKQDASFRTEVEHAWNSDLCSVDVNRATLVCGFLARNHGKLKIDSPTSLFQALLAAALPIINSEASNRPLLARILDVIPLSERSDAAFEMAKYLVHDPIKLTWLDDLIEQIPPEEKCEIAKQMLHYLPFIDGGNRFNALLRKVRKIPIQERAEVFLCVKTVLKNLKDFDALYTLINELRKIPAENRLQLFTKVNTFFTDHAMFYGMPLEALIPLVSRVPVDELDQVLLAIDSYLSENLDKSTVRYWECWSNLIFYTGSLSMPDREEIWQRVKPYLKCPIANDDTEEKGTNPAKFFSTLVITAVCLPHHLWVRVLTALDGSVNLRELGWNGRDDADFLKIVMDQDPDLREEIMQAWDNILRSENIPKAKFVCDLIDCNSEVLGILSNTPLHDQMVITGINISNRNNEDSPFKFHADLKKKRAEPVVIKEPTEVIDGIPIRVDSSYLKSLAHETTLVCDLPDHMKFFSEMVTYLEKSSESAALKKTVQDLSGMPWDELFSGALRSGYLKELLRIDRQSLAKASIVKVRFVKIIDILVNSAIARPNNQELHEFCLEPFLTILASIQGCIGGKDEGIHGLYNAYMEEKNFDDESTSSMDYINSFIHTCVENMFSGNNLFFKRLTGLKQNEEVPQAAHHSVYVKNLIHEEVGLPHDFRYDPSTRQLLVSLIEKSRQHVVTEFYNIFRGTYLIGEFMNLSKRDRNFYAKVSPLLSADDQEKAWSIDTTSGVCKITTYGAMKVLQKVGVLKR